MEGIGRVGPTGTNRDDAAFVVRAASLVAVPWANGGGVTRVIADGPDYRLSLATIADAGPFSSIPGVLRHFALVAGKIELTGAVTGVFDETGAPCTFAGDSPVHAVPLGGPALALNLMVPVGAPALRLERCEPGATVEALAVFACDAQTIAGVALGMHDTLFPAAPVRLAARALRVVR